MTSARRSLLAVTSQMPWPLASGGHLRTYHLLRTLAARFDVRLVAPSSTGDEEGTRALQRAGIRPTVVRVPRRTPMSEAIRITKAALTREPYVLFARHRRRAVHRALVDEATRQRPDVLYLDHLDSLVYADIAPGVPVVADMHNVYSRLAERSAAEAPDFCRRRYLAREAALIAAKEEIAARAAHTLMTVSEGDARYFEVLGPSRVVVVPNGVDCAAHDGPTIAGLPGPPTIIYVGSLDWPPNASAVRFLAGEVLPSLRRNHADARLLIVGRRPPADIAAVAHAQPGVELAADVPDIAPYLRRAHVLAVPLDVGGGTRLKILEAFAAGVPVVSTPVGCEGIDASDGEHLIVAERRQFADAIHRLLLDPAAARERACRARRLALERYDWSAIGRRALEVITCAAADRRRPAATAPLYSLAREFSEP